MWYYEGKEITSHDDLHPDCTDFVYKITYESGKKYLGKKTVKSLRRLKPTKKQLAIRKNFKRVEIKNLPFLNYKGSSEETELEIVSIKEILFQCSSKRTSTYIETALLFETDAIFNEKYLNKNIQGCYFDNALDGLLPGDIND